MAQAWKPVAKRHPLPESWSLGVIGDKYDGD